MAPASKDDTHMVALAQEKQCVASSGFLGGVSVGSWGLLGFAAGSDLRGSSFALVCSLSSVLCVIQGYEPKTCRNGGRAGRRSTHGGGS